MLRRVVGRTADFLKRLNGSRVAGISLIENTLTRIPGIEQMQIVQDALEHIVVRIVPGADFSAAHRAELGAYFRETFAGTTIELEDVSAISQEANGKYRFSICKVPD
jgi:phenylacetate-CoA ligase